MRKISLLTIALLIGMVFSLQTASAQFPKIPKIPKPSQPQPTPADTTQPMSDTRPAQPQPKSRNPTKPTAAAGTATINKPSIQITLRTNQQY